MKIAITSQKANLLCNILLPGYFALLLATTMLMAGSGFAQSSDSDVVTLQQFSAKYTVENDYITGGKATLSLSKNQQDNFDFILRTKPTGIFKITGKGNITEHAVLPLLSQPFEASSYSYADKGNSDRNYQINFNRDDAEFIFKTNEQSQTLAMPAGTLDRLSVTLAVLAEAQKNDRFSSVEIDALDGSRAQKITFTNHGPEQIATGLGNISALRISKDRKSSNRETIFWFAQIKDNGPTIPVKIEHFKRRKLTMRLLITDFSSIE